METESGPAEAESGDQPAAESVASVVLIDRSEELAPICGRVDGAPTWAVVIHAPEGNRQLSTELGMRRLLHHAADAGKVVAIATRSSSLASRARELGVPVARKPQHVRWDAGGRHVVRVGRLNVAAPSVGRYVQVGIIVGVALVALFLVVAMAPSAKVTAYPPTETVTQILTVTAAESFDAVNFDTMEVPASKVSAERSFTLALKTTGTVQVGTKPAKATVTISNATQAGVAVAQGTVVLAGTDSFLFSVDEAVTVPPAGSATAAVTAVKPGVAGNVPAGAIAGWQAERLKFLKITNAAAAAGGISEPRPAVDSKDVLALSDLAATLRDSEAVRGSLVEARPRDAVFLSTASSDLELGDARPPVGTPSEVVWMDVKVTLSALAVLESTLDDVARHVLALEGTEGEFVPGTITAVETGARLLDADSASIQTELRVQGELAREVTAKGIRAAVLGKTEADAKSTLSERYGIQDADVRLSGWAPRLPRFGFRVEVELAARDAPTRSGPLLLDDTTSTTSSAATPPAGAGSR